MRVMKLAATLSGFSLLFFLSSWSLFDSSPKEQSNTIDKESSAKALQAYKNQSALDFINRHLPDINLKTEAGKKRLELLVEQYGSTDSKDELILLYDYFPNAFETKESPSIAVAKFFLTDQETHRYREIRLQWKGREQQPEEWFFLDVQALTIDGKLKEAKELLTSRTLQGAAETNRLTQLALLFVVDNPEQSWKYLVEATQKDPENPNLSMYKAALLESAEKNEKALSEYIFAIQKDPENPIPREQLAEFYFRQHDYALALELLQDTLLEPSLDSIWLKALFLSRTVRPIEFDWEEADQPTGELIPLVNYLSSLPPGVFWNGTAFQKIKGQESYLEKRQETFWLRLLMALKQGQEAKAKDLLQQNSFQMISWWPDLECRLKAALTYRQAHREEGGNLHERSAHLLDMSDPSIDVCLKSLSMISEVPISEVKTIDIPGNLREVILSNEIFSALFLSEGLDEGAIQLHSLSIFPKEFPSWITLRFTEALNKNRGPKAALQFAEKQPATPELALLIAEMAYDTGSKESAIDQLKMLYKRNDDHGLKAAKFLTAIYLEEGNHFAARDAILAQPSFAEEPSSKELLARIALQSGDPVTANTLYQDIERQSPEAKSYLAKKAFADKNWEKAKTLTEELIRQYPDNSGLKENLHKILLEEEKEHFGAKNY